MNSCCGRRAQPQIVVHAGGHRLDRLAADGVAPLEAQAARHVDVADQRLRASAARPRAPTPERLLAAVLHHAVVLLRGRHNLPGLEHIVRAGLLHVHVLARLAGPDGLQRVAVVGRGDGDRVDGLVLQQLAQVGVTPRDAFPWPSRPRPRCALSTDSSMSQMRGDLHVGHLAVGADVVAAPAAHAHAGHPHRVVGAGERAGTQRRARRDCGTQKVSSVHAV